MSSTSADLHAPRLIIRASAGAGKTFQLSSRYVSLLRKAPPECILASTFTRKAAGEILERILLRLAAAALCERDLAPLRQTAGEPPLTRADCLQLLSHLTRRLHRVSISTLDAFFARLAGAHALELGIPPRWRILDQTEADALKAQAIEIVLREGVAQDVVQLMRLLAKGQDQRSVSRLVSDVIAAFYPVFLAAPADAWERFPACQFLSEAQQRELLAELEAVSLDGKIHDARVQFCEEFRQQQWDSLIDRALLVNVLAGKTVYSRQQLPGELCGPVKRLGQHVQAMLISVWKNQTTATRQLLARFHEVYARLKDQAGGLEFEDVTRKLNDALERYHVDPAYRLDADIEHVLLDEFQDTSLPQWQVVRRFAERACSLPRGSFFCVGDSKQAIYGWRGGEARIFDTIHDHLPGLAEHPLDTSYRSSPEVIQVVNQALTGLTHHDGFAEYADVLERWRRGFPEHTTTRSDAPGYVRLLTAPQPRDVAGGNATRGDQTAETLRYAAAVVGSLRQQAPRSSIGVLTRSNRAVGQLIYELQQLGIDASEEGGNPITDAAVVELVLSMMTLADHPGDTIAGFHLAHSPLGELVGYARHDDAVAAHDFSRRLRERLAREGYGSVIHDLVAPLAASCNARELRRLQQLAELADEYDALGPSLRARDFVAFIRLQGRDAPTASRVRVMTLHQAKGLEFDSVVLPELDGQLFRPPAHVSLIPPADSSPSLVAVYRRKEMFQTMGGDLLAAYEQTSKRMFYEALCVLYVALTRAAHSLHMIIAPNSKQAFTKNFAGLLRAALAPGELPVPEATLYELGDPRWHERVDWKTPPTVPPAAPLQLVFREAPLSRRLPRITPSTHDALPPRPDRSAAPPAAAPEDSARSSARARGSLFHRWLEELEWLEDGLPGEEALLQLAGQYDRTPEQGRADLADLRQALENPSVRTLLTQASLRRPDALPFSDAVREELTAAGTVLEVCRELPFALREGEALLTGSIDRMVIFRRAGRPVAADVIDFKTDGLGAGETLFSDKVDFYRDQMAAYRRAACRLLALPAERVSVRLVFLHSGRVASV